MSAPQLTVQLGTVAVLAGEKLGTGFFVGADGTILTCFHNIGDKATGEFARQVEVRFQGQSFAATTRAVSPDPQRLDYALLQLEGGVLPPEALLMPVRRALADRGEQQARLFATFGYRVAEGASAESSYTPRVPGQGEVARLQLASQPEDVQQIRGGMSGAPIYDRRQRAVVGMIVSRIREPDDQGGGLREDRPYGLALEAIEEQLAPLRRRLDEYELWQLLEPDFQRGQLPQTMQAQLIRRLRLIIPLPDADEASNEQVHVLPWLRRAALTGQDTLTPLLTLIETKYHGLWESLRTRRLSASMLIRRIVPFTNRERETEYMLQDMPPLYTCYSAPTGYGKTELLRELERRYQRKEGWLTLFYIHRGPPLSSSLALAQALFQHLGPPQESETTLATYCRLLRQELGAARGLLMLIDDADRLLAGEHAGRMFREQLLNQLRTELSTNKIELICCVAVRPIATSWQVPAQALVERLSGRGDGQRRQSAAGRQRRKPQLSPFQYRNIRSTLVSLHKELKLPKAEIDKTAAYILMMTGGHPGCMAELIEDWRSVEQTSTFQQRTAEHRGIVRRVAEAAYNSLPQKLQPQMVSLSVFRYLTYEVLEALQKHGTIDPTLDTFELHRQLKGTGCYTEIGDLMTDSLVRSLLLRRLAWDEPEQYASLLRLAGKIYWQLLEGLPERAQHDRRDAQLLLSALQVEIELYHLNKPDTPEQRKRRRKQFFSPRGPLYKALARARECSPELMRGLSGPLIDLINVEESDHDHEFCFLLNYVFRDEDYAYGELNEQLITILGEQVI